MYKLHGFFTQNSLKTLYVLEELDVEWEYCYVDLGKGTNRSDEFLAMNPVGKVPVLEHDGECLFESGAICRYVAGVERSPLYPADKLQRARVDQWMTYFTCHPGRWLTSMYFERIIKPLVGMGAADEAKCEEASKFLHQQLKVLETWLGSHEWLANDTFSIAEPFALAYMEQTNSIGYSLDNYPSVKAWFERLENREATAAVRELVKPYVQAMLSQD